MIKTFMQNDEAVSPVVGVMLMLVVTIIIAAVVSGFAGGLVGGAQIAPQASIGISTGYGFSTDGSQLNADVFDISFEHLGGDPIVTKDIEIITYLTLPNGTVVQHKQTANSLYMRESSYSGGKYARIPYVYDLQKYTTSEIYYTQANIELGNVSGSWFGESTWMPGEIARTYKKDATAAFLGLIDEESIYPVNSDAYAAGADLLEECIQKNCQLDIKLLHVPSGKYILDKSIVLQG